MWRCDYCRAMFDDRDTGINHARARHSRDYTACRQVAGDGPGRPGGPTRTRWLPSLRGVTLLSHLAVAILFAPLLAMLRHGGASS
jgi:hypothetical protein